MSPRATLVLLLAALAACLAPTTASAGSRLVVKSPGNGATIANKLVLRAKLVAARGEKIRSARFFVEDALVAVDRKAPFATSGGTPFDGSALPAGPHDLRVSVTYRVRRPGGQVVRRTTERTVRVEVFRPPTITTLLPSSTWSLKFRDEFTSAGTSRRNWQSQRDDWIKGPVPYSNLEGAGYRPSNVRVENGVMKIATARTPAAGFSQSTGSVNTRGAFWFKYGYIEARILVPRCAGCWPAFWMLPRADHWPPEIDIIEYFNTAKQVIPYSAVHWRANNAQKERYFSERLMLSPQDNYIGTWHTYGALWTRDTVQFYLDGFAGPQFSRPSRIPHKAMYPIIQLAVGRGHKPAPGSTMQVDYVRAWQRK